MDSRFRGNDGGIEKPVARMKHSKIREFSPTHSRITLHSIRATVLYVDTKSYLDSRTCLNYTPLPSSYPVRRHFGSTPIWTFLLDIVCMVCIINA